jgi:hypothetical protein
MMDLLAYLRKPAEMRMLEELPEQLRYGDRTAHGGFPPWPAGLDLLIDPATSELVGVARVAPKQYWNAARELAEMLDSRLVTYNDLSSPQSRKRYRMDPNEAHVLEIVWSPRDNIEYVPALLEDDCWYATDESRAAAHPQFVALGIWHLDEVLAQYGLQMPATPRQHAAW